MGASAVNDDSATPWGPKRYTFALPSIQDSPHLVYLSIQEVMRDKGAFEMWHALLYFFSLVHIAKSLYANSSSTCVQCMHLLKSWCDRYFLIPHNSCRLVWQYLRFGAIINWFIQVTNTEEPAAKPSSKSHHPCGLTHSLRSSKSTFSQTFERQVYTVSEVENW